MRLVTPRSTFLRVNGPAIFGLPSYFLLSNPDDSSAYVRVNFDVRSDGIHNGFVRRVEEEKKGYFLLINYVFLEAIP